MALLKEMIGGGTSAGQARALCGGSGAIVAAGSTLATGTPVTASVTMVTAADGTKGVTLLGLAPGESVTLFNNSGSTLKVYPFSSTIGISVAGTGIGTAGSAFSQLTYKATTYIGMSATQVIANTTA